jgi:hypothetical protein
LDPPPCLSGAIIIQMQRYKQCRACMAAAE